MKKFISAKDAGDINALVDEAIELKKTVYTPEVGRGKTIGLVFLNPSLRTRLSTHRAALNLGMDVMVMNLNNDGWNIEFQDGAVMDGSSQEHIKDAVKVMSQYCDILGVRSFPGLKNRDEDYRENIMSDFVKYSDVPVVSLESATLHPLQSLTDMITIKEFGIQRPKIAVTWAPHPRVLPQAVTNSFLQWVKHTDAEVVLTHPIGYELKEEFSEGVAYTSNQKEAFEGAEFVYAKNWSSYSHYGEKPDVSEDWTVREELMDLTNNGKFMHCLPIRRNVVATDGVIDNSIVYQQAKNREIGAQVVLKRILENL
ncbi:MAG: acetylornithine carbamoyltransferase [Cyclobacteriaceae bacterium]